MLEFSSYSNICICVQFIQVSAVELKSNTTNKQLPIKVKGYVGRFLIDMRGEIKNYPLFDTTVGVKRSLKQ